VMLVFIVSMTITYEVEAGTLHRLQLTRMNAFDLLTGISLNNSFGHHHRFADIFLRNGVGI